MSARTIELAANEILINGRKQTLVPGYTEWSYREFYYSSRKWEITLFYKQTPVTFLRKRAKGYAPQGLANKVLYPDLDAVIEAHKNCWDVKYTDDYNQKHGIVQWCQRGTAVATVTVMVTGEEMDLLESIARANGQDVETLAAYAVRLLLEREKNKVVG